VVAAVKYKRYKCVCGFMTSDGSEAEPMERSVLGKCLERWSVFRIGGQRQ